MAFSICNFKFMVLGFHHYARSLEFSKDYGDGNVSCSWDKVTTFYNKQGKKLFKFGLAYDNVQLLVRDVKNTQKSISNQKKKK